MRMSGPFRIFRALPRGYNPMFALCNSVPFGSNRSAFERPARRCPSLGRAAQGVALRIGERAEAVRRAAGITRAKRGKTRPARAENGDRWLANQDDPHAQQLATGAVERLDRHLARPQAFGQRHAAANDQVAADRQCDRL